MEPDRPESRRLARAAVVAPGPSAPPTGLIGATAPGPSAPPAGAIGATALRHVGLTVSDLDAALRFWETLLGRRARARTVLRRPYVGQLVGMPGVEIDAAFVELGGDAELELLAYRTANRTPLGDATHHPGHAHLCLAVEDLDAAWARATACGAEPVGSSGPVLIDTGPNAGTRAAYLRVPPDGHTLELFEQVSSS